MVNIYEDNGGGGVGTLLSSTTVPTADTNATFLDLSFLGGNVYSFDVPISDLALDAGSCWLSVGVIMITLGPPDDNYIWANATNNVNGIRDFDAGVNGIWDGPETGVNDLAFAINAVPEPGTLVVVLGLAGVFASRRRRG